MEFSHLKEKILATPGEKRVIIVYNPRSSKAQRVVDEVVRPIQEIPGTMVGKYEVKPTDVDDNASELSRILLNDDIVIAAGGDGTSTIGLNGVMLSGKQVRFMALPFGNFNDMARTMKRASGKNFYPLETVIDGKHYRYAACYFTIGMFAESTKIFDEKKTRKKLQTGDKGLLFSVLTLAKWYFKNKRQQFIPSFKYSSTVKIYDKNGAYQVKMKILGEDETKNTSDYIAVNGVSVAKMMKGSDRFYESKLDFLSTTEKLKGFFSLVGFMSKSVVKRIPGVVSTEDVITFPDYGDVMIQAEGEYKKLNHVGKIVIRKSEKPIRIL